MCCIKKKKKLPREFHELCLHTNYSSHLHTLVTTMFDDVLEPVTRVSTRVRRCTIVVVMHIK